MISVCIPVGPYPHYKRYLGECLDSVRAQTMPANDIVLVDDMAGLDPAEYPDCNIWRAPWRLGIPAVANVAYMLGKSDWVFQLSCDDKLMPNCLEQLWKAWEAHRDPLGFYWVDILYSTGETQALPCGHAMIHKQLWRHTGGYPPESGVGACDHIFMNMALLHPQDVHLFEVPGGPLYWHREHPEQYTAHQNAHQSSIFDVRDVYAERFRPLSEHPWGRYEP